MLKYTFLLISSDFFEKFLKIFPTISQKFSKISQECPTLCVFRPTSQKFNAWFLKNLAKYAKNNKFLLIFCEFFEKCLKYFRNFLKNPTFCVFRSNAQKFNAWFLKNFAKYAKNNKFLLIFWKISKKFSKISQKCPSCVFRLNAQGFNAWFKRLLKNMLK